MENTGEFSRWKGRVAAVTGASSGIGTAVANALAARGVDVILGARRMDKLKEVAEAINAQGRGNAYAASLDLQDEGSIRDFFQFAVDEAGGADVLVNNAGLGHFSPLMSGDTESWRQMLEVNVLGLCVATREAIAGIQSRGTDGHIVHISSMAAHRVPPNSGVYSATKYAVRSLTESLRQELWEAKVPIRVSAVSPAFVETEFAEKYHRRPEAAKEAYGQYPVLRPEDVANAVVYCLEQPHEVQVHDVLVRPRQQQS